MQTLLRIHSVFLSNRGLAFAALGFARDGEADRPHLLGLRVAKRARVQRARAAEPVEPRNEICVAVVVHACGDGASDGVSCPALRPGRVWLALGWLVRGPRREGRCNVGRARCAKASPKWVFPLRSRHLDLPNKYTSPCGVRGCAWCAAFSPDFPPAEGRARRAERTKRRGGGWASRGRRAPGALYPRSNKIAGPRAHVNVALCNRSLAIWKFRN